MVESFFTLLSQLEATFNPENPAGLLILLSLAVVTDIGVPVPFVLDSILILAAYRSGLLSVQVLLIVVALFVGRQIGSGVLYLLSRYLGKAFICWLKRHFPSIGNGLDSFAGRLCHWAPVAITTGRLTPGLLQITSVAAGAIRLRYSSFFLGVTLASLVYDGILIVLGLIAAHSPRAHDINFTIWLLISMLIIVCFLWPVIFTVLRRSGKKSVPQAEGSQPANIKPVKSPRF